MSREPTTYQRCLAAHMGQAGSMISATPRRSGSLLAGILTTAAIFAASIFGGMAVALWLLQSAPR